MSDGETTSDDFEEIEDEAESSESAGGPASDPIDPPESPPDDEAAREIDETDVVEEVDGTSDLPDAPDAPPGGGPDAAAPASDAGHPDRESVLERALAPVLDPPDPEPEGLDPLPGADASNPEPAVELFAGGESRGRISLDAGRTVIGSGTAAEDETPDVDLDDVEGADAAFWGRHAAVYRRDGHCVLWMLADAPASFEGEALELGEHRRLEDGDIALMGDVGIRFELPDRGL